MTKEIAEEEAYYYKALYDNMFTRFQRYLRAYQGKPVEQAQHQAKMLLKQVNRMSAEGFSFSV